MQGHERFVELEAFDPALNHVQRLEERLVEPTTLLIVTAQVQPLWILQVLDGGFHEACCLCEILGHISQPPAQLLAALVDLTQPRLDLRLGQCPVGRQVEEVLLLRVQSGKLLGELLLQLPCCRFLLVDAFLHVGAYMVDEVWTKAETGVVLLDRFLQPLHIDIGRVTRMVLLAEAEEVHVFGAVAVGGFLNDHPLCDACSPTRTAEQRPFEVVVMYAPLFLGSGTGFDDVLHSIEQIYVYQCIVSSLDLLVFVCHVTDVVAVA
ncbi:hypothetical protein RM479_20955 [Nocardiopsis sp. DSM 44743]|uniref:Uncharacterized protein n=1 Tax=Nocardiopsis lambiniae TaxID=3075539 RepID=A0ABU2MEB2_9ACTN|nr:hypothetical protein [Nocardiopsis sp. DSM 44743]MDT0330897.1 hypothetical protein [Nocardiopsis sp. DSM 44743]